MTEEQLYNKIMEKKPKTIRPFKVQNHIVYLLCPECEIWKPVESYSLQTPGRRFFHVRPECKSCQAFKFEQYLKKNPLKAAQFIEQRKKTLQDKKEKEEFQKAE